VGGREGRQRKRKTRDKIHPFKGTPPMTYFFQLGPTS
jgi:hypothetical protein